MKLKDLPQRYLFTVLTLNGTVKMMLDGVGMDHVKFMNLFWEIYRKTFQKHAIDMTLEYYPFKMEGFPDMPLSNLKAYFENECQSALVDTHNRWASTDMEKIYQRTMEELRLQGVVSTYKNILRSGETSPVASSSG
jgi:hypothetical protein